MLEMLQESTHMERAMGVYRRDIQPSAGMEVVKESLVNGRVKMNLLRMTINLKGRNAHLFYKYVLSICQIIVHVLEIQQ